MAQITRQGSWLLLTCEDKFAALQVDGLSGDSPAVLHQGSIREIPVAEESKAKQKETPEANSGEKPDEQANQINRVILSGALSRDGLYVGLCDSKKTVSVWKKAAADAETAFSLVATHALSTRSDRLTFTPDGSSLLVADKSGDVIHISVGEGERAAEGDSCKILLGHLSMLLGIEVSPCGRYVLTSDRDEKIRISRLPNAYNIEGFCLGHTEFVSAIKVLSESVAVSGSGDGTVRTWKYLDEERPEIDRRVCGEDAGVKQGDVEMTGAGEDEKQDSKLKRAQVPGVRAIKVFGNKVVVHMENLNGVLVYSCNAEGKLVFDRKMELKHPVVDFDFVDQQGLVVLLAAENKALVEYLDVTGSGSNPETATIESFFTGMGTECLNRVKLAGSQSLDGYYKRWFDNVNVYKENKDKRIKEKRTADVVTSLANTNASKKLRSPETAV